MSISVEMVTLDSSDPLPLARWWAQRLDGSILAENEGWFVLVKPAAGPTLAFQMVDDPTPGKNRMHLDLGVDDLTAARQEFLDAGATLVADRQLYGIAWVVLADPDGNQFCIAGRGAQA